MYCPRCGREIKDKFCPNCGPENIATPMPSTPPKRSGKVGIIITFLVLFVIILVFALVPKIVKNSLNSILRGSELKTEKQVMNFLNKNYPNDEFEVISSKEITLRVVDGRDAKSKKIYKDKGGYYSWTVKSKKTNIEFEVYDYFIEDVLNVVEAKDNYLDKTIEIIRDRIKKENTDPRTYGVWHENDGIYIAYNIGYKQRWLYFYLEDFSSKEEFAEFIFEQIPKINEIIDNVTKKIMFSSHNRIKIDHAKCQKGSECGKGVVLFDEVKNSQELVEIINEIEKEV